MSSRNFRSHCVGKLSACLALALVVVAGCTARAVDEVKTGRTENSVQTSEGQTAAAGQMIELGGKGRRATEKFTLEAFQQFVRQKTSQLKEQKNAHEVEYIVTLEGKHARLTARVKS